MIKILNDAEKKLHKRFVLLSLLFAVILPAIGVFVLNGGELLIYYNAQVHESVFGFYMAQVLDVLNSILSTAMTIVSLAVFCASVLTFGVGKSKIVVLLSFLSAFVGEICSFGVLYLMVYTGNHNYTTSMLRSELPIIFDVAVFNVFIYLLLILACLILYYFSKGISCELYSIDKSFKRKIKITFIAVASIKTGSYIFDLLFKDYPNNITLNYVVSVIILPLIYIVLGFVAAYFALKYFIRHIDGLVNKYGVDLKMTQGIVKDKKDKKEKKKA